METGKFFSCQLMIQMLSNDEIFKNLTFDIIQRQQFINYLSMSNIIDCQ